MADRYKNMKQEDFDVILEGIIGEMTSGEIMATPGAYEVFSEELNNEVLRRWKERNDEDQSEDK